jgi:hypothetical protein
MEKELQKLGLEAKEAIATLQKLKRQFTLGKIDYATCIRRGSPLINKFNVYTKALAKERKMPYKPITLGYFMR